MFLHRLSIPSTFQQTTLVLALAAGLSACGGSSTSSDTTSLATDTSSTSTTTDTATSTLSGTAAKGIIRKARVSAYSVGDSGLNGTALASTLTADDGSYTLDLGDYSGSVVIELEGDTDGAEMKCDQSGGCDVDDDGTLDADFGEFYPLSGLGLTLRSAIPNASGSVTAHLTSQTTMAAALAEGSASGLDADSIRLANSRVANLFGITGGLITTDVLDVTDPDALEAASEQARENALLSASIYSACRKQGSGLTEFINTYVADDGELYENDDDETLEDSYVSIDDIYGEATSLLDNELSGHATSTRTWAHARRALAKSKSVGTHTDTPTSDDVNESAVEIAKSFVTDLSDFIASTELSDYADSMDSFAAEAQIAQHYAGSEVQAVVNALMESNLAAQEAALHLLEGDAITSPYVASNEVEVTFDTVDSVTSIDVATTINGVRVELTYQGSLTTVSRYNRSGEQVSKTLTFTGAGSAENDVFIATLSDIVSKTVLVESASGTQISSAVLTGSSTWAEQNVSDPVSFEGSLTAQLYDAAIDYGSAASAAAVADARVLLKLAGSFSDAQGNSLTAGFAVDASGVGLSFVGDSLSDLTVEGDLDGLDSAAWALVFESVLDGFEEDAKVAYSWTLADSVMSATLTAKMVGKIYTVQMVQAVGESEPSSLVISDSLGTQLVLISEDESAYSIKVNGAEVATISKTAVGAMVRYSDGSFALL